MKNIFQILCIVAILLIFAELDASVWYVHPDSTLNSIQAGLNYCSADDTVLVAAGTYYENIIWPSTQGIDLISESGSDITIINGGGTTNVIQITTGADSTTIISGFTIRNGNSYYGGGIHCENSSIKIDSCIIEENNATRGAGLAIIENSSVILTGNIIQNNESMAGGAGVFIDSSSVTLINNTISDNQAINNTLGAGLSIWNYSEVVCTSNSIQNNYCGGTGGGFYIGQSTVTLVDNLIEDNYLQSGSGAGIAAWSSTVTLIGNEILNNDASPVYPGPGEGGGATFSECSIPLIENNIIRGNKGVSFGGGLNLYEISPPCTLSNNIIENNLAQEGGGVYISFSYNETPVMINNTIQGNTASGYGGGISVVYAQPVISNNMIIGNIADDGLYGGHGGGIFMEVQGVSLEFPGYASILNNIIENNHANCLGGGIELQISEPMQYYPRINGNTILNNSASNSGGIMWSNPRCSDGIPPASCFMDNIIQGNHASFDGGGMYCTGANDYHFVIGTNNTIYGNSADSLGGGIHCKIRNLMLKKSLIAGNTSGYGGAIALEHRWGIDPHHTCLFDSCLILDNGSIDDMNSGLAWIHYNTEDTLHISNSHVYYNTFQPDIEVVNNTNIVIPLEHNFWWDTTAAGIEALFEGSNDHDPWELDFIPGVPEEPTQIESVINFDNTYSQEVDFINGNPDTLYLRINGTDCLSDIREAAIAIIKSSIYPNGIAVALLETDTSSGIYQGTAIVKTQTGNDSIRIDDINQTIKVNESGDTIVITANRDSTASYTVYYEQTNTDEESIVARIYSLSQNYPNPFNPSGAGCSQTTTISFNLTAEDAEDAKIVIYNIKGQKIRQYSIFNSQSSIVWDGTDDSGKAVSSGIYFYQLKTGNNFSSTKKMLLLK